MAYPVQRWSNCLQIQQKVWVILIVPLAEAENVKSLILCSNVTFA